MAQTKRKRRTKHRGNAAGVVEARGRTGRPPTPAERKRAARQQGGAGQRRELKPPTLQRAAFKALGFALLLLVLTQTGLFGKQQTLGSGLILAGMSLLLYIPAAYATDKWAYNRQERRKLQRG